MPAATGAGASIAGKQVFPPDNPWNTDISSQPVDPNSANLIAGIGLSTGLHPDFGTVWNGAPNGIPYVVVAGTQPRVPVSFDYADESDPGPYPIPPAAPIEGGASSTGAAAYTILIADTITFTGGATFSDDFSSLPDKSPIKAVALAE